MRILFLTILFCVFSLSCEGQSLLLNKIAGPDNFSSGTYVRTYNPTTGDSLWVWIQHLEDWERPNYEAAKEADLVAWCYPQKYPHKKHALPNSKGIIEVISFKDKILIVEVGSEEWKSIPFRYR